ncbi:hypothetical protein V491_07534 [Pseudogymnoascus sp. VKM F-3775]|nr:hypothetical protein V491_07534 [Pseudogymnoascus sp. VKM F-3775]
MDGCSPITNRFVSELTLAPAIPANTTAASSAPDTMNFQSTTLGRFTWATPASAKTLNIVDAENRQLGM